METRSKTGISDRKCFRCETTACQSEMLCFSSLDIPFSDRNFFVEIDLNFELCWEHLSKGS